MKKMKRFLLVLLILTVAFIWVHSAMDPETSANESGWVMKIVEPFLELFVGEGNVTEHLVRKLAHFSEFALLGFELLAYISICRGSSSFSNAAYSCNFALITAVIDETVQIFSGRGSSLKDVWLDFAGALFGGLIAVAVVRIAGKRLSSDSINFKK